MLLKLLDLTSKANVIDPVWQLGGCAQQISFSRNQSARKCLFCI